jgi:hypothetical protein
MRSLLIRAHQTRIPRHIGGEDSGEAASGGHRSPQHLISRAEINPKFPIPHPFFKVGPFAAAPVFCNKLLDQPGTQLLARRLPCPPTSSAIST